MEQKLNFNLFFICKLFGCQVSVLFYFGLFSLYSNPQDTEYPEWSRVEKKPWILNIRNGPIHETSFLLLNSIIKDSKNIVKSQLDK